MKTCTECGEPKAETEFYGNGRGGLFARCKVCCRRRQGPISLARYRELKHNDLCPGCKGTPSPGHVHCAECRAGLRQVQSLRKGEDVLL